MSLNYITDYNYSGNVQTNQSVMFQVSLRTLGGTGAARNDRRLDVSLCATIR